MSTVKKQITIKKDTVLFKQGDAGDCAYVIESGKVLIYIEKGNVEIPIAHIKKGEIFGEMSLIDNSPRSASVRAVEDTVLNKITKDQLIDRYQGSDQLVQLLLRVMMNRLRRNNNSLISSNANGVPEEALQEEANSNDAFGNIRLENRLLEALNNQEFEMFYQPIVNMELNKIIGCEALIRWKDPIVGYIQPDKFIDFLENSSLMIPVGQWIFDTCFKDLNEIKKHFDDEFVMSVNVSGRQFVHPDFLTDLEKLTWKHKVSAKNIKLEVTERVMMDGMNAIEILNRSTEKGFQISIDDFGTGFSSLQYLSHMPVNYLKIDRTFVSKVNRDPKVLAIVKSMIYMAKELGMSIIAEGVETQEEREILLGLDAKLAQGWLYCKAVPLSDFIKLPAYFAVKKAA